MHLAFFGLLILGHGAIDMHQGALPALLPSLKDSLGLSYAEAASILLALNLSSSIIQPLFGHITDRWALNWVLPAAIILASLGFAGIYFAFSYFQILMAVLFCGLGIAAYHPQAVKETLTFGSIRKTGVMSWFMVGGNSGFALGPIFVVGCLAWFGREGILIFAIPCIVIGFIFIIALKSKKQSPAALAAKHTGQIKPIGKRIKPLGILFASVVLRASVQSGMLVFTPFYFNQFLSMHHADLGLVLGFYLLCGAIGTLLGGQIATKIDEKKVFLFSVFAITPFTAFFLLSDSSLLYLWLGLTGAAITAPWASMVVMAQQILPDRTGLASSLMMGLAIGSGGLGATVLGFVADYMGLMWVMYIITTLPILSGLVGLFVKIPRALAQK